MQRQGPAIVLVALLLWLSGYAARPQTPSDEIAELRKQVSELSERLEELELAQAHASAPAPATGAASNVAQSARLGGSATLSSFSTSSNSVLGESSFDVWDARF